MHKSKPDKDRIDKLLVEMELAETREKAKKLVMAGLVKVDGQPASKPGMFVSRTSRIEVLAKEHPYVSRGGLKMQHALDHYGIPVEDLIVMDVGISTGGFADCLLQRGAKKIYGIDVGYGQIDWKLRTDPRVILFERTNIRYFNGEKIPDPIDLTVIDVSFISLTLVIPAVKNITAAPVLALIKPQFEVGKNQVGKGGIVKDPVQQESCVKKIVEFCGGLGYLHREPFLSPVAGTKGNREFFLYIYPERIIDER
jgi:23S rRNA (cytidine1920-2'-O)/16S rRNA (cytidine1409-2'-O)-methyltransferase